MQHITHLKHSYLRLPKADMPYPTFAAGEVVATATGRATTPFPKFDLTTNRKVTNSYRRARQWLLENANLEAQARANTTQARLFSLMDHKNLSTTDGDDLVLYLFDLEMAAIEQQYPKRLKALSPAPAWHDPTQEQPVWLLTYQEDRVSRPRRYAFGSRKNAIEYAKKRQIKEYNVAPHHSFEGSR